MRPDDVNLITFSLRQACTTILVLGLGEASDLTMLMQTLSIANTYQGVEKSQHHQDEPFQYRDFLRANINSNLAEPITKRPFHPPIFSQASQGQSVSRMWR
jgi:hypothetical protein